MASRCSAQDVVRCTVCEDAFAPMHCDICQVDLCKDCVEKHVSDVSKFHKVVSHKQKEPVPEYPKCPKHSKKYCELFCLQCDIPICAHCISSQNHIGHKQIDILENFENKLELIAKDLKELEKSIYPKCLEIASDIRGQKADLKENLEKLTTALLQHGENLHREIDTVITKLKSDVTEMNTKHLSVLNKQDYEVTCELFEIGQTIADIKKILNSKDICLVTTYTSRNASYKRLPLKIKVDLPSFFPKKINRNQIYQMFGCLSDLSFTTEENVLSEEIQEAVSSSSRKLLQDEPIILATIHTEFSDLFSVSCLGDEKIWTRGQDKIMRLYNLHGELLNSIESRSGNVPRDIAVAREGYLVYTDYKEGTLNIVKDSKNGQVIRLRGWKPLSVCSSSVGDLLMVMCSDDDKQTKVVRCSDSQLKQIIQYDDKGQPHYSSGGLKYICENRNLDICVSDCVAGAVVVVNQAGKLRFTYTGPPSTIDDLFDPVGIITDSQGWILTADYDHHRIHILDQDGQFLRYIDNCNLKSPWGLCVDTKDNLFVAECESGKVKKIQYYS